MRKSLQEHQLGQDKKKKDKQDDKYNDKNGQTGFQQPANTVNITYGGDSTFNKRAQKLAWREILNLEPAIQKPLKHSEVPITFS